MGTKILLITICVVAFIGVIILLIKRNQKDKKELMKELIEEENARLPKESDTEVDPTSVI